MKTFKLYACLMLLALAMVCMTGCSNTNGTGTTSGAGNPTTTQPTTAATKAPTTGAGTTVDETSGGVINGLINDVEEGVDDITGETDKNETKATTGAVKETTK